MRSRMLAAVLAVALGRFVLVGTQPSGAAPTGRFTFKAVPGRPQLSGAADPQVSGGSAAEGVTAAANASKAAPVVSDDVQANGENKANSSSQYGSGEGQPQNETSIAVNPTNALNVLAASNDYAPAVDAIMGMYVSQDGAKTFSLSRFVPQIITPDRRMLGSGDPVVAFDRAGVAYASFISFGRADCDSYIAVSRSTDGGVTWSVPVDGESAGTGLVVGDGIVIHNGGPADCRFFHDKEWMAAGRRPSGVAVLPDTDPDHISVDRLYVTWTQFDSDVDGLGFVDAPIMLSMSDDQGRHWTNPREISGKASFCDFQFGDTDGRCDEDQFSVPVVDPRSGRVSVAFENFNTASTVTNRYLLVYSDDGGQTWSRPKFVTDVYDGADKYPICNGRQTLDLMCARTNANGNLDLDPRNGALYVSWADNRNGTAANTNTDVFVVKSTDAGTTWTAPLNITSTSVDDQWFPWLSVAANGTVAVSYFDRRYSGPKLIDTSLSVSTNGGSSYQTRRVSEVSWNPDVAYRLGVFIGDYNGLDITNKTAFPVWTDARFGEPNTEGNNPPHQQTDIMVDAEPL